MVWAITCVDTMKDSRDTCYPVSGQMAAADIAQGVNLCATLNVTHITCDVFFDYPDYMALWVSAIRATGANVWFRPHWNAWEGNNGVSATMTPAQYLSSTVAFIQAHSTLFASGDIFDACSEADNSPYWVNTYGANYTNGAPNTATNAFNQYHLDMNTQFQAAFVGMGIVGVQTGIHTLNSFWAKSINSFYPSTVTKLGGYIALDSYPEGSSTTPSVCAAARLTELQTVAGARPTAKIILGELGYSNAVTVDDTTQQNVLAAELAAVATVPQIVGMNYWAAQGTDTSGGHTHLFNGVRGAWGLRPAATTLANFYYQQLYGTNSATVAVNGSSLNVTTIGSRLYVAEASLTMDQAIGQRSTADFTIIDEAGTHHYEQGTAVTITDDLSGQRIFGGIINDAKEVPPDTTLPLLVHSIPCVDNHWYADKRRIAYSNTNVSAGTIVSDIVTQVLASEGVIIQRGVNKCSPQQSNVESSDMTPFSQGSSVTISQDTTPGNAWQGTGSLKVITSGGANTFEQIEAHVDATQFTPGASLTISCYIKASTGTPSLRFFVQSDTGAIGTVNTVTLSTSWQRITKTVTLPNPITNVYFAIRLDTGSPAQAITFYMDGLQIEQAAAASAWELGGLSQSVQSGPTVNEFTSNYETCAACLDALAQASNFYWQIDANKVLWFVLPGTIQAPWSLTPSDVLHGSGLSLERANPTYRNRQYMLDVLGQTATQTETRRGDGNTQAFLMSYALSTTPTITLNGAAQTVGIGGVDTGKQWYWNAGSNVVSQDPSGTKLNAIYQTLIATGATAGTFTLSYKGVATANINWNDTAATVQTRLQALSTVGTGNALVTGGPLPSTSMLITFTGALAQDTTQVLVGTNALTGGTPTLASVAPLSVVYVGEFPSVVLSSNDAEVTAQLGREGGVGTGYVEDVATDSTVKTTAGAFQVAAGYLARYGQLGRKLSFTTMRGGLAPGQMLTVTLPMHNLISQPMLIESVRVTHHDGRFWYAVVALLGPINNTWVQFFQALASQSKTTVDKINLGSSNTLTLLQSFTATKATSAAFTPTVYTCPIVGPTTLCGPTRIVC